MTKRESLLAYFEKQRANQQAKLRHAVLECDQQTAAMWVKHYDRMCEMMSA